MAAPDPPEAPNLSRRATSGAVWSGASSAVVQGITVLAYGVVAWVLGPEALGTVALALAVVEAARMLQGFGLAPAIVSGRVHEQEVVASAHWLVFALGVTIGGAFAASAPLAAEFFDDPSVASLLVVAALLPAIDGLAVVPRALLQRQNRFDRIGVADTLTQAGVGAAAIALVFLGAGVWSLVLPAIAGRAVRAAWLWRIAPLSAWRRPSLVALRPHLAECGHLTGAAAADYLFLNADKLVVGRFFGPGDLGRYHFAHSCLARALMVLSQAVSIPLLANLGDVRHDPARFGRAVVRAMRTVARVTLPVTLGGALLAPELVSLVFGERWADTGTLLRWFLALAAVQSIAALIGPVWLALGRTRLILAWGLTANLSVVLVFLFGAGIGSVEAVAACFALYSAFVLSPATLWLTRKWCGIPLDGLTSALGVVLFDVSFTLAGVELVGTLAAAAAMPSGARLALQVALGGLFYLVILRGLRRAELRELVALLPDRVGSIVGRLLALRGGSAPAPASSH